MPTVKLTQTEQVKRALERGQAITPIDALSRFGCFRLGARIWDLKRAGLDIETEFVTTRHGARVARYRLRAA